MNDRHILYMILRMGEYFLHFFLFVKSLLWCVDERIWDANSTHDHLRIRAIHDVRPDMTHIKSNAMLLIISMACNVIQSIDYTQKSTISTLALKLSVSAIIYPWWTATLLLPPKSISYSFFQSCIAGILKRATTLFSECFAHENHPNFLKSLGHRPRPSMTI